MRSEASREYSLYGKKYYYVIDEVRAWKLEMERIRKISIKGLEE